MDNSNQTTKSVSKQPTKKLIFVLGGVVVLACLGGAFFFLQGAVASRDRDLADLNAKADQLNKDKENLGSKNMNLEKVVKALQNQIDKQGQTISSSDDQTTGQQTVTKPVAKIVVTGVKDQPGSDFTIPGQPVIKGDVRVVSITITNLTATEQSYDHFQFEATLTTGLIVKPRIYSPIESTVWNSSKLAAGASQNIALLFGTDQNLATLNWNPTGATEPLVTTVPAP